MEHIKRILFVCTGNTCRSVMAKGLFEKIWSENSKDPVEVDSAGISAGPGLAVPVEVRDLMMQEGIDVSTHISKPLTEDMIDSFDVIFVMDNMHKDYILRSRPDAWEKIHLLRGFAASGDSNTEIPDPIGQTYEVYKMCFNIIKESVQRVVKNI